MHVKCTALIHSINIEKKSCLILFFSQYLKQNENNNFYITNKQKYGYLFHVAGRRNITNKKYMGRKLTKNFPLQFFISF